MKGYAPLLVCCSMMVIACVKAEELHLICAGQTSPESSPPQEWKKEFVADLTAVELIGYDSEWRDANEDAKASVVVEIDGSFIKIYDSLIGGDPKKFKLIVISRITGEIHIVDLPENKISVSGKCSGATGSGSDNSDE